MSKIQRNLFLTLLAAMVYVSYFYVAGQIMASRNPASSVSNLSCIESAEIVLKNTFRQEEKTVWSRFKNIVWPDFDFKKFRSYRKSFQDLPEDYWTEGRIAELSSGEEILAFLEATSHQEMLTKKPTGWSNRQITKMTSQAPATLRTGDIENLVTKLYEISLGERYATMGFFNISNAAQKKVINRIVGEDLAVYGLKKTLMKYSLFKEAGFLERWSTFKSSLLAKTLLATFYGYTSLKQGFAPMYLPELGMLRMSPELSEKFIVDGFEKTFPVMIEEMGLTAKAYALYPILRKRYMQGVTLFLVAVAGYKTYDYVKISLEQGEKQGQLEETLTADETSAISKKLALYTKVNLPPECRAYFDCLISFAEGEEKFVKPENKWFQGCINLNNSDGACTVDPVEVLSQLEK